jgi:hypothetical protein
MGRNNPSMTLGALPLKEDTDWIGGIAFGASRIAL